MEWILIIGAVIVVIALIGLFMRGRSPAPGKTREARRSDDGTAVLGAVAVSSTIDDDGGGDPGGGDPGGGDSGGGGSSGGGDGGGGGGGGDGGGGGAV